MNSSLREYFETRAQSLSDCAALEIESIPHLGDSLRIVPHDRRALGVYFIDSGNNHYQVGFDHEHDTPDEDAREREDVDSFLTPAIEGRIRMLVGARRAVIQVREGDEFKVFGTHYGVGAWYPIPGWRRRANVVTYPPYRGNHI